MAGIRAFVGLNGSGKTLSMIDMLAVPAWRSGQLVVGNLTLDPSGAGCDPALYRPLSSADELLELHDCVLLLDEISSALPARQWAALGPDLVRRLEQLRKARVVVAWTGPSWARCDKVLRDVTQLVTLCQASWPDRWVRHDDEVRWFPKAVRDDNGKKVRASRDWPPNRLIRMATYAREDFDDFEAHRAATKLKPRSRGYLWRPASVAARCYQSQEQVSLLDHVAESGGSCIRCGGSRPRPKCTCAPVGEGVPGGAPGPTSITGRR